MRITARLRGADDLRRKLRRLSKVTQRAAVEDALTAGAEIIAEGERQRVEVRSGRGRNSIAVEVDRASAMPSVHTGPTVPDGIHLQYLERGTAHMRPEPFVRPTVDADGDRALDAVADRLRKNIERAAEG